MKYDPNNELSESEQSALSEDEFFDYLDSKVKYLNQFTKPLGEYHTKRYATLAAGAQNRQLTQKQFDTAKKIGKEGDKINTQRIIDKMKEKGVEEPSKQVKNVKTNRSQWFD